MPGLEFEKATFYSLRELQTKSYSSHGVGLLHERYNMSKKQPSIFKCRNARIGIISLSLDHVILHSYERRMLQILSVPEL